QAVGGKHSTPGCVGGSLTRTSPARATDLYRPRAVRVRIRVPTSGAASVQRLLASAPSATTGVTLGGRRLGAGARWTGAPDVDRLARDARGYVVVVAGDSATLVSARLRRRAL
ncbi:MAG: hypothetical protein ACR2NR_08035, partial [Solirubrobacteraceae bacterium]